VPDLPLADRHETVLPAAPDDAGTALADALGEPDEARRRERVAEVVAAHPTWIEGWVALSELGRDAIERYAYARVGYHRGLDSLRAHGWGGRGYVRWSQATNRPFLRGLVLLRAAAAEIGEDAEVSRLTAFLHDLDPDWDDALVTG
jgi:hypothetical protein